MKQRRPLSFCFLCILSLTTLAFTQNNDPCIQAQLDANDSVWRPGWWIGGFFGNHLIPYGGIALAYLYSPKPKSVPYDDPQAQERYLDCFRRSKKRIQIENQSVGLIGLMLSYATLRHTMNMVWKTPEKGDAPFFLPEERSGLYYIGGLALTFAAFRSLEPEPGEPSVNIYRKLSKEEICSVYGNIRIVPSGEDYKVRAVDRGELEDLRVRFTSEEMADGTGLWNMVQAYEDFTIRFVETGEDFAIREVAGGEGCDHSDSREKP